MPKRTTHWRRTAASGLRRNRHHPRRRRHRCNQCYSTSASELATTTRNGKQRCRMECVIHNSRSQSLPNTMNDERHGALRRHRAATAPSRAVTRRHAPSPRRHAPPPRRHRAATCRHRAVTRRRRAPATASSRHRKHRPPHANPIHQQARHQRFAPTSHSRTIRTANDRVANTHYTRARKRQHGGERRRRTHSARKRPRAGTPRAPPMERRASPPPPLWREKITRTRQ